MSDINNLGAFGSIEDVWKKYPEGGKEGDYLTISGVKHRWNKYEKIWENAIYVTSSASRRIQSFYGDVDVHNDLRVGGTLKARAVKQPNLGLFESVDTLKAAYPHPEVGQWAVIGNTTPGSVYRCDIAGEWEATGEVGGLDAVDLNKYDTAITELKNSVSDLDTSNDNIKQAIKTESDARALEDDNITKRINELDGTKIKWKIGSSVPSIYEAVGVISNAQDEYENALNTIARTQKAQGTSISTHTTEISKINEQLQNIGAVPTIDIGTTANEGVDIFKLPEGEYILKAIGDWDGTVGRLSISRVINNVRFPPAMYFGAFVSGFVGVAEDKLILSPTYNTLQYSGGCWRKVGYTQDMLSYNDLSDKPSINGVPLIGDVTTADLSINAIDAINI